MVQDSIPRRSDESIFAEFLLWNSGNCKDKFNLFVEDKNGVLTYSELLRRKYGEHFNFNVYPCMSRSSVLDKYEIWKRKYQKINNTLFLIDRDFSLWIDGESEENNHLLIWAYFTMENYFINYESTIFLLNVLMPHKSNFECKQLFNDYELWIRDLYVLLKPLFITFVISHINNLSKNTSLSPHIFYDQNANMINTQQIAYNIESVKSECQLKCIDYEEEYRRIESYYDSRPDGGFHELIKGKYLVTYLIYEVNARAKKESPKTKVISENNAYFYLVLKTPIETFNELWNKISYLKNANISLTSTQL